MENLLSMPTRPFEVLLGKIVPYILVGYVQVGLILLGGAFSVSRADGGQRGAAARGRVSFIVANLAVGITFSTVAKNQLQAMQMACFLFCPPSCSPDSCSRFAACRVWAQRLGELFRSPISCASCAGSCSRGTACRRVATALADRALRGGRRRHRREALPADAGLAGCVARG